MKLSCPKDSTHKEFSASAHEVRGWIVDESGDFVRSDDQGCQSLAAGPDFYGSVCMVTLPDGTICGEDADISD